MTTMTLKRLPTPDRSDVLFNFSLHLHYQISRLTQTSTIVYFVGHLIGICTVYHVAFLPQQDVGIQFFLTGNPLSPTCIIFVSKVQPYNHAFISEGIFPVLDHRISSLIECNTH